VNWRAFAKDLMKLCAKHGVKLSACYQGHVYISPQGAKTAGEDVYNDFAASPTCVTLGEAGDSNFIKMEK